MGDRSGRVLRGLVGLGALMVVMTAFGRAGVAAGGDRTPAQPAGTAAAGTPECKDTGITVTFVRGSVELDTNGRGALTGVAAWLQGGDDRSVRLEGYADRKGGVVSNQRLSEKRAQAAKDFLVAHGITSDRIMAFGHGEEPDETIKGAAARVVRVTACDIHKELAMAALPGPSSKANAPAAEPGPDPAEDDEATPAPKKPLPAAPAPAPAPNTDAVSLPSPRKTTVNPPPPPVRVPPDVPASGLGVEATVGGGAIGFIDQGARNVSGTGASWDARIMFGSRLPIAIETAYVGSVQSIEALGLSNDSLLVGNGVEGTLRVNLTRRRIQPYVFGGAGWTHYQLANATANTSSILGKDDVGTVPLGAGVSGRFLNSLIVDVRGTYRATFNDDLLRASSLNMNNSMQSWNAAARIGFEF